MGGLAGVAWAIIILAIIAVICVMLEN